ncbi:MAG: hypothetical protein PF447_00065 [Spirochaetaceae bacterium]|jgi:peptide/nickel transport system permease protein|nr:hypothetical protein [Spirochaetaceae bacterium]
MKKQHLWEIPLLKFKRNKLGVFSFYILLILYVSLLLQGFIAPYEPNHKFKDYSFHPPHRIHLFHQGQFKGPFVYQYRISNHF